MLAQTLVLVAMLALLGASAAAGIAGGARTASSAAARALIVPGVEAALAQFEATTGATIAAQIPSAATLTTPPSAIAALNGGATWSEQRYVASAADGSADAVVVDVMPTALAVPACTPAGPAVNAGPDRELDGQCAGIVQETRVSLRVTADAGPVDAGGVPSPLAHGRFIVTLRAFAQPPYVALVGAKDAPATGDAHEGDDGGYADTTIHVTYTCSPALGDCSASAPPPSDDPTTLPWQNGNQSGAPL